MTTTLIAGLGYVGQALADHLHASGEAVAGLTKTPESAAALAAAKPYPVFPCDVSDCKAVASLASSIRHPASSIRNVIHCASSGRAGPEGYRAVYLEGVRHMADVFPGSRLIFTSSTGVYAQTGGETVTEDSTAKPDRETARILLEAEAIVLSRKGIVARLAGIYGPGRSYLLNRFFDGEAVVEDGGDRFLNQVHRDDIVSALALLLQSPAAAGIYNVCDDEPLRQRECGAFLAEHFDKPLPPSGSRGGNSKRGWTSKRVSNARLRALGWRPKYPSFRDAILEDAEFVASIQQRP